MYSGTIPLDHELWPVELKAEMAIRRHANIVRAVRREVTRQACRFPAEAFETYLRWLAAGCVDPVDAFRSEHAKP